MGAIVVATQAAAKSAISAKFREIPYYKRTIRRFSEDGSMAEGLEPIVIMTPWIENHWNDLVLLPEVQALRRALPVFAGKGDDELKDVLATSLAPAIRGLRVEPTAERIARMMQLRLDRGGHVCLLRAPLENFECPDLARIELPNGIVLRKMTAKERTEMVSRMGGVSAISRHVQWVTKWMLEKEEVYAEEAAIDDQETIAQYDAVVTILRFRKTSPVGFREVHTEPLSWGSPAFTSGHIDRVGVERHGEPYELDASEIDAFRALVAELSPVLVKPKDSSLKLALSRFNDGCQRIRENDAVIDLVIALDALLLPGIEAELSHRFSQRGSMLMPAADRSKTFDLLREAYKQRSKLVHGALRHPRVGLRKELQQIAAHLFLKVVRMQAKGLAHHAIMEGVDAFMLRSNSDFDVNTIMRNDDGR